MWKKKDDALHKKRYGQYFSGEKVAKLPVSLLPEEIRPENVADPMAGVGDLLSAVITRFPECRNVFGVEIDKEIAQKCRWNLPKAHIINEDAFCSAGLIAKSGWDLVITNPPYVRYQLQSDYAGEMPSGKAVRENLIHQIYMMNHLNHADKDFFVTLSQGYSGLSDMAVPAWIFCAALVRENGYLAMVVPDTWFNREYAKPVQYLLLKCFDSLVIAKDINAVRFADALVRTCLVVARRKPTGSLKESMGCHTFVLNLTSELAGNHSLVDNLKFEGCSGFEALKKLLDRKKSCDGQGYYAEMRKESDLFPFLFDGSKRNRWMAMDDMDTVPRKNLPAGLKQFLREETEETYISLEDMGIHCGQGLRTGANDFFYLAPEKREETGWIIKNKTWQNTKDETYIPNKYMVKCVQNRGEIAGISINPDDIKKAVLYIKNEIRLSDVGLCSPEVKSSDLILTLLP